MAHALLHKNWVWVATSILIVLVALFLSINVIPSSEVRPRGGAEDVLALPDRVSAGELNVLFVLIDTLRADHLGTYGYERPTSPTLDYFTGRGVRFDRHLSQSSWTKSSMASLWTALNPVSTGITRYEHGLPDEAQMPAEIFRDAGFQTVGLFRNGWVAPRFGFGQGFEVYTRPTGTRIDAELRRDNPTLRVGGSDADAIDVAVEFIRNAERDRPWFLYVHLMDVHEYTYSEETALFGSSHVDLYDNSIRWVDSVMNHLLSFLAESGELDHTLIVLTSDHGEAFRERGIEGHARAVYRETTIVPFMIFFPFTLDPGVTIDVHTSGVDVWPTILDLLGLPALGSGEGVSRKPEILAALRGDGPASEPGPAYAFLDQRWGQPPSENLFLTVAVVDGRHRYVLTQEGGAGTKRELFDSVADPAERHNIASEEPDVAERMDELAQGLLEQTSIWSSGVEQLQLDELELNQLRALGYEIP
jgi:arylsulfatase A-like enzyme